MNMYIVASITDDISSTSSQNIILSRRKTTFHAKFWYLLLPCRAENHQKIIVQYTTKEEPYFFITRPFSSSLVIRLLSFASS